jgi:hypothetical protein
MVLLVLLEEMTFLAHPTTGMGLLKSRLRNIMKIILQPKLGFLMSSQPLL